MRIAAALLACALVLTGCGGSAEPSTSDATGTGPTVNIRINGGEVAPQGERVDVTAGEQVWLEVTSDADEEIHVHSDPEHTFEVKAGKTNTFSFTIDTPGQVAVEAHHLDVTILQLVVEP